MGSIKSDERITCDICGKTTCASGEDILTFGEWMRRKELTVHYFCLLLSSNLPQHGTNDNSGIMGFLLRDIRREVVEARKRICFYCNEPGANIKCNNCGKYFDLVCAPMNYCTLQFQGQFFSYCDSCPPMDEYRQQLVAHPPPDATCDICFDRIVYFKLHQVVFPECCHLGFVHKMCMRQYALVSGYYLTCIWCRSPKFRDSIRMQGVFVPDRDAEWEKRRDAYQDLHRRTLRCDEKDCLCPHGRSFTKNTWYIYPCQLCGSTGAHARCLVASSMQEANMFTCSGCQEVEKKLTEKTNENPESSSYFVTKEAAKLPESDDETDSSVVTVIPNRRTTVNSISSSQVSVSPKKTPSPPPVKLLQLRESFSCPGEPFFYLVIYEFDDKYKCKGSCTLRFNDQDPRIKDRSEEALRRVQIQPNDVLFRNKDCGIYDIVDKYANTYNLYIN